MELNHPLPDELVELIAERFRVLGDPTRIKLLDRLRDGEASVGELVRATGSSQQNVSKHLQVLLQGGFVARTRNGNYVHYAIADPTVFLICEQVCEGLRSRLSELDAVIRDGARR